MKATLKDQREAPMVLRAGEGQVEMQENLLCSRNRKKAGGTGWKGKLVVVRPEWTKVTGHAGPGTKWGRMEVLSHEERIGYLGLRNKLSQRLVT